MKCDKSGVIPLFILHKYYILVLSYKSWGMIFLKTTTYMKCTDCGLIWQKQGSLEQMGILDGNNCSNCGGEVVIVNVGLGTHSE